ncbi:hypothetical protein AAZX31_08G315100 [Glycine max]
MKKNKNHHTTLLQSIDSCHATLTSTMQGMMKQLSIQPQAVTPLPQPPPLPAHYTTAANPHNFFQPPCFPTYPYAYSLSISIDFLFLHYTTVEFHSTVAMVHLVFLDHCRCVLDKKSVLLVFFMLITCSFN